MQLTRLRGLRHSPFRHSVYPRASSIRMQLTRLRGLRLSSFLGHSNTYIHELECSWPDLGDWDSALPALYLAHSNCIRMQLTRLRGLRLGGFSLYLLFSLPLLECSWPDLGDWDFSHRFDTKSQVEILECSWPDLGDWDHKWFSLYLLFSLPY